MCQKIDNVYSFKLMAIIIKTAVEIEKMRVAGRLAAEVLDMITPFVVAGITTDELNSRCHDYIVDVQKAIPAPLNYGGFPKSICTSINHVVCHGIPGDKKLKNGDIINIDITVIKDGYHGDTSKMFLVGDVDTMKAADAAKAKAAQKLIDVTYACMWRGIAVVKPGHTFLDIAKAIDTHAHANRYSVVETFCGHGIGRKFHEDPQVLHYVPVNKHELNRLDVEMKPGMIFTIEPMINMGKKGTTILKDGWTAITKDRSLSAQWEHTILVTDSGFEVLTLREEERGYLAKVEAKKVETAKAV
ncbi:MAG: type I methionyl aminopeptidase [Francisellaceae bacterium]